MGNVRKMKIAAFSDKTFNSEVGSYEVMLNPDTITLNRAIDYNEKQPPDSSQPSMKYKMTPGSSLSFALIIDCTGIVDAKRTILPKELRQLLSVVYDYNGSIHRPNFVKLTWGIGEVFKGVLTKFDTTYSLFDSNGVPLRAKVSLNFKSYTDPATVAKTENKQSPDLTHLVNVTLGDSLPGLSQKVYDTPDYYIQLAEFNGLDKFRSLQTGVDLIFPPVVAEGSVS